MGWDCGIIDFPGPVGDMTDADVLRPVFIEKPGDMGVTVAGYPGDKAKYTMWKSEGTILQVGAGGEVLEHTCDTKNGQSGAPIYDKNNQVVGIHNNSPNGGDDSISVRCNYGARMTDDLVWMLEHY
ncbi:MAG: trypsin-like peptidase domain-containing protein [Clostridiales bacterium]|jgi:V8-like Glu-specific endopeptidase|nr:trypsin-like peptidase domain-containing protein [Clostridiales bacterium]